VKEKFDIAVVGSGAAGIAAAICAARAGGKTLLLDKNSAPGGTGGFSGLTTLCGLYDDAGNFLSDGFPREFAGMISETAPLKMGKVFVLPYRPEKFRAVAEKLFVTEKNLKTLWNLSLKKIVVEKNKIISLNNFEVGAVIDCSGTAEVARKIGIEILETDETTQASSVIFPLQNVAREIFSPADAVQILLSVARAGFAPLNFSSNLEANSITAKFSGQPDEVPQLIEFLRANVRGFENCSTPLKKFPVARRAGKMIVGEYILTGADVLGAKKFSDSVARCAWPIEQWNAAGEVRLRYLPPQEFYEIPARSLRAKKIKNLFMAGKTISADVDAIASARVMGCCLATGEAAAKLAADFANAH
jgi:hypothetical protein